MFLKGRRAPRRTKRVFAVAVKRKFWGGGWGKAGVRGERAPTRGARTVRREGRSQVTKGIHSNRKRKENRGGKGGITWRRCHAAQIGPILH